MQLSKSYIAIIVVAVVAVAAVAVYVAMPHDNGEKEKVTVDSYSSEPLLWIRGNADGDKDIDEKDIQIIQAVIDENGKVSTYEWCDANNDGVIDNKDVDQVKAMIDGTAKIIAFKDLDNNVHNYTVRESVNLVTVNKCQAEDVLIVTNTHKASKVVGGDQQCQKYNNELCFNFGTDEKKGEVLVTGTKNGEVQAEIVDRLIAQYGHVEICLGSIKSYGTNLESDFGTDPAVSIIRLPSWEDGTISGVLTYGYLFGGVAKNECWDQAMKYYDWYMKYLTPISEVVEKIPENERPKILTVYVKDCYPGATNKVLSVTSGDYERSELSGGNNVGDYFGEGYVAFTGDEMAACEKLKGIDIIYVQPSAIYGEDGKQAVIDAVQLGINELDGYITTDTKIYSLSFMLTAGPGCPVSFVFYAKTMYPDNPAFADFDANKVFKEYLELIGWDKRSDVSDIPGYGPGYTTSPFH
ncbi:MAG: hypothetical protein MJZ38_05330 [archaeon]|nr:hypothetical protein [archaeon]